MEPSAAMSRMISAKAFDVSREESTIESIVCLISPMSREISVDCTAADWASLRISSATTAKPLPA